MERTATVTILEVARAANVSKTTTSDILRGADRHYNAETIAKVQQTASRLGYRANAAARLLRQGKPDLIGIAVGVRQRPHLNRLVVAAHDECLQRGYQPVLFEPLHLMPQRHFSPFPSPAMLAGLLSIDLSMERTLPEFYASLCDHLPIVALYEVASPVVAAVTTDWPAAMHLAVEHFVQLGHRRIAYAHNPQALFPSDFSRNRAWKKAVKRFAPHVDDCRVTFLTPTELAERGGVFVNATHISDIAVQIVAALHALKNPPTALLCSSDEVALAVIARLGSAGWKLPQQLSVLGVDGIDFCEYSQPTLTTIEQDTKGIAAAALDHLLLGMKARQAGTAPPSCTHSRIVPRLVMRQSTMVHNAPKSRIGPRR